MTHVQPPLQEAHAAEILTKDTELHQILQRLATEIKQKENQIEQLTSQLQVSMYYKLVSGHLNSHILCHSCDIIPIYTCTVLLKIWPF